MHTVESGRYPLGLFGRELPGISAADYGPIRVQGRLPARPPPRYRNCPWLAGDTSLRR